MTARSAARLPASAAVSASRHGRSRGHRAPIERDALPARGVAILVMISVLGLVPARTFAQPAPADAGAAPADAPADPSNAPADPGAGSAASPGPTFEPPHARGPTDVAYPADAPPHTDPIVVTVKLTVDATGAVG